jgi:hypothetical protein
MNSIKTKVDIDIFKSGTTHITQLFLESLWKVPGKLADF